MQTGIEWDEQSYDGTDDCTLMELRWVLKIVFFNSVKENCKTHISIFFYHAKNIIFF
jgi:hypothetical protein